MSKPALFLCFTALALSACQTTARQPARDAVLDSPSPDVIAAVSDAVSKALGGRKTWLADDILQAKPRLIIDPKYVDDRSLQRPDHFRLQKAGETCQLLHEETGETFLLPAARCIIF